MQRLVYSPKAFIFIKRRNGDIADVSQYCTSGSVERRVSAVSTAKFSLRNPNNLFTSRAGQHAAFFPMDPITIYLQRLKGRPVRVFTGFLDETPYYELYPGVIEFSASCTLKKLLYTYFDPALPYTRSFLSEYGWIANADGTIKNPQAEMGIETDKDGGLGALLFATMRDIGHWKENTLKIEALPKDLITRMSNMLRTFEDNNTEARKELETLIERFVGSGDYGQSGSTTNGDKVDVSKYDGDVAEIIYQVGKAMGVPIKYMLAAFETGIVESGMRNLNHGDADSQGWRQERTSIYGTGANGPTNVNASAKRFFQECKQHDTGDSQTAGQLAADVQRPAAQYRGRYEDARAAAASLMEKTKSRVDKKNKDSGGTSSNPDRTVRVGDKPSSGLINQLSQSIDVHGAGPGMEVIAQLAKSFGLQVTAGRDDHSKFTSSGNISDHSKGWAVDESNGTAPTPEMDAFNKFMKENLAGIIKQLIWRDHDQFQGFVVTGHMNHVHVALKQEYAMSKQRTLDAVTNALNGRPVGAPGATTLPNKSVLWVGDGLAVGTYPYVKSSLGDHVIDFEGAEGTNSTAAFNKLDAKMTNKVKIVIFDAGTADNMSDPAAFRSRLDQVKDTANGAHIIIFTLNNGDATDAQVKGMNDAIRDFGSSGGVTVIDWGARDNLIGSDGIHPNKDGYKTRGTMTNTAIQPLIATTTDNTGDPSTGNDAIMSRVNATVLAATMNWASWEETVMATALQGNKSLLNDKPLMPFIQQMAESSLRQFMSMPNGDFFAFYPDYFGETWHRPPYWFIDDIEVLEGRVKLNDAALVTHEYVIGNTTLSSDALQNTIMSAGSVSITNAFQSAWVTTEADEKKNSKDQPTEKLFHAFNRVLKQDEAIQFLERYGARPHVEDFPFILNPFYELFLAYQHFMQAWSRQFLSPFKLTFMPELYPGGKVGFPEHGLQMYVEEVTHTWDYNSGFVTEADLSAPAAMLDSKGKPINGNLPINMPTALLEVSSEKTDPGGKGGSSGVVVAPGPNGELRPT